MTAIRRRARALAGAILVLAAAGHPAHAARYAIDQAHGRTRRVSLPIAIVREGAAFVAVPDAMR